VHKLISCFLLLEQAKAQDLFSETREILIIVIVSDDLELTVAILRIESKKLIRTDMYVFFSISILFIALHVSQSHPGDVKI